MIRLTSPYTIKLVGNAPAPILVTAQVIGSVPDVVIRRGERGPAGPPGTPGSIDGYTHRQTSPSASWSIAHGLNRPPNVSVYVDGQIGLADVELIDDNNVAITFPSATSGIAALT